MTTTLADPFAALDATIDVKASDRVTPAWEGPIPASVISWVQSAVDDNVKVTIPVPAGNLTLATQLRAAIQAEVKNSYKSLSAYVRDILDEETVVGVSFTVGAPRGRRKAA